MRRLLSVVALVSVALTFSSSGALAAPQTARVSLAHKAQIVDGGLAAVVRVRASCHAGLEVLEAFVTLDQDGVATDFGFFPLTCDGTKHEFRVRVNTFDDTRFHRGDGFGSALVLVEDPGTGETSQAQDSGVVRLR
jgi:hypothetical protein